MRRPLANVSLSVGFLLISFIIFEIGIRSVGSYDEDGNFTVFNKSLRPHRPRVAAIREKISHLSSPFTVVTYDPVLGWSPRPDRVSGNGLYRYNSLGLRSAPSEYSPSAPIDTVRIAIFGDSFTHGDEVPFEQTWGHHLENKLRQNGLSAEVINFGVAGYGMDQAFLRWRAVGHTFSPDVVIFGLQMENVKRNVNLLRPVYLRETSLPFSKPRFLLTTNGLQLINSPPLPPEKLPDVLNDIGGWDLAEYEHFGEPDDYLARAWHLSKSFSLCFDIVHAAAKSFGTNDRSFYDLSKEPARLALKIIEEFKHSVEGYNKKFLVVHLPNRSHLRNLLARKELTYSQLLAKIAENNDLIRPEFDLLREAQRSSPDTLFENGGHYTANANALVADVIVRSFLSDSGKDLATSKIPAR